MARAGTVFVNVRGNTVPFVADVRSALDGPLRSIGALAGAAALGVGSIGAAAISASTDFNQGLSNVQAVSNATSEDLGRLRQSALDAGAATVFSATDAANAEAELAKAGISTADVLSGGLRGALDLAAAGQLDLGQAATITAQALNTFNLSGDQTSHVADVLAAGAVKSAADVSQLGIALQQGGLVAKQTGLSLEDTVGVLSLFADNALIGSDAGTSLKTALQRLTPQSTQAAQAMKDLGLSFFDQQGNFVGIEETAQRLHDALSGLSTEQRQTALTTIFGADAIRSAGILYEAGAQGVREYVDAVNDQGAAQRVASQQLDNLAGDLEQLRGSIETALIGLGQNGDTELRQLAQGATEFVNRLGEVAQDPVFQSIVDNVIRTVGQIASAFDGIEGDVSGFFSGLEKSNVDRFFTTLRDDIEGLEGPIAGLAASLSLMAATKLPFIGSGLGQLLPSISPVTGILAGLVLQSDEARKALGDLFGGLVAAAGPVAGVVGGLADAMGTLADQSWLVVPALNAFVASKIVSTVTPWISSLNNLRVSMRATWAELAANGAATRASSGLYELGGSAVVAEGQVFGFGSASQAAATEASQLGARSLIAAGQVAAIGPAAQSAALGIGRAATAMAALGTGNRGWQFWTPQTEAGLARLRTEIGSVQALGRGSFIDVESWEQDVSRLALGAGTVKVATTAAESATAGFGSTLGRVGASVRNMATSIGDVARGSIRSLQSALSGLDFTNLAVTGGITAGLIVYEHWSQHTRAMESDTRDLIDALADLDTARATSAINDSLQGAIDAASGGAELKSILANLNRAGLATSDITTAVDQSSASLKGWIDAWNDTNKAIYDTPDVPGFVGNQVPALVRQLYAMRDAGVINNGELSRFLDLIGDVAGQGVNAATALKQQGEAFRAEAQDIQLSADAQRDLNTVLSDNASLADRGAALNRLKQAYPELADAAGIASSATTDTGEKTAWFQGILDRLTGSAAANTSAMTDAAGGVSAYGQASEDALGSVLDLLSAQSQLVDANQRVEDARQKLADILSGNTDGLRNAKEALAEAQAAYTRAVEDNTQKAADALDRFKSAEDKLYDAQRKAGLNATSKTVQLGALDVEGPDLAREVDQAQRELDKARKDYQDAASGNTDQLRNARSRLADAEAKVAEETAKTGPASREARDAQRELDAAQLQVVQSAEQVSTSMASLSSDDIPAAIAAVQALGDQHLLTTDQVNGTIGAILREAAALQGLQAIAAGGAAAPPAPPAPVPAGASLGAGARPGAVNAERENRGFAGTPASSAPAAQAFNPAPTAAQFLQQVHAALSANYPNPQLGEQAVVYGIRFVWTSDGWVQVSNLQGARPGQLNAFADGGVLTGSGRSALEGLGSLPRSSGIEPGRGHGLVQWAEGTTGGEAHIFIPLGSNKAEKAQPVLMEAARRMGAFQPGSDLGELLLRQLSPARQFADGGVLGGGFVTPSIPSGAAPARATTTSATAVLDQTDVVAAIEQMTERLSAEIHQLLYQRPNITAEIPVHLAGLETVYRDMLRALQDSVPFGTAAGASEGFRRR